MIRAQRPRSFNSVVRALTHKNAQRKDMDAAKVGELQSRAEKPNQVKYQFNNQQVSLQ